MRPALIASLLIIIGLVGGLIPTGLALASAGPSETVSILNPGLFQAVVERREIRTSVRLLSEKPLPTYRITSTLLFLCPPGPLKKLLGDYAALQSMGPYFKRVEFRPKESVLIVTGKVLGYEFGAAVRVDDQSPQRIRYTTLAGPSKGLAADVFLEPHRVGRSESTVAYLEAEFRVHSTWIPRWAVEKAARLVVETVAAKAREKLERR